MADKRIYELDGSNVAQDTDFFAIDSSADGTRKISRVNLLGAIETNITNLLSDVGTLLTKVGTGTLNTVAQTLIGAINELKATSDSMLTFGSYTGTTSSSGLLIPSPSISATNKVIVCAYGTKSAIVIPYVYSSDSTWRFLICNSQLNPSANLNLTVNYITTPKS